MKNSGSALLDPTNSRWGTLFGHSMPMCQCLGYNLLHRSMEGLSKCRELATKLLAEMRSRKMPVAEVASKLKAKAHDVRASMTKKAKKLSSHRLGGHKANGLDGAQQGERYRDKEGNDDMVEPQSGGEEHD